MWGDPKLGDECGGNGCCVLDTCGEHEECAEGVEAGPQVLEAAVKLAKSKAKLEKKQKEGFLSVVRTLSESVGRDLVSAKPQFAIRKHSESALWTPCL